jgi:hypothetical protein
MQEKTLYQEIVKRCMIRERYEAMLESNKEKGIEKTSEELIEELEKIKEKCHAITAARRVPTLIDDYPKYLGYVTAALISFGVHICLNLSDVVDLTNAVFGKESLSRVKNNISMARFEKQDVVIHVLAVLDDLYTYERAQNGEQLIPGKTNNWEENKKYLDYLMPIIEALDLGIEVEEIKLKYK